MWKETGAMCIPELAWSVWRK